MAKVLIIDDDAHITQLLQTHLSEEGYEVSIAHRADEGVAQAASINPDLILLDVMLPDATGFQICSRLRTAESTRSVPIIMITGVAKFPNQQAFGMERGANEYVLKPFKILELGELVHSYIGNEDKKRELAKRGAAEAPPTIPPPLHIITPDKIDVRPAESFSELTALLRKALLKSKPTD